MERPIPINRIPKSDSIWEYSNPNKVEKKAKKYMINVFRSTRPSKKYMVQNADAKWIHFGQMDYEDFTKHEDEERRQRFLKRNARWAKSLPLTPAWLSYYLLWN